MQKKNYILGNHRDAIFDKMTRWQRYRGLREQCIDDYIAQFKLMKKINVLLTLITK